MINLLSRWKLRWSKLWANAKRQKMARWLSIGAIALGGSNDHRIQSNDHRIHGQGELLASCWRSLQIHALELQKNPKHR